MADPTWLKQVQEQLLEGELKALNEISIVKGETTRWRANCYIISNSASQHNLFSLGSSLRAIMTWLCIHHQFCYFSLEFDCILEDNKIRKLQLVASPLNDINCKTSWEAIWKQVHGILVQDDDGQWKQLLKESDGSPVMFWDLVADGSMAQLLALLNRSRRRLWWALRAAVQRDSELAEFADLPPEPPTPAASQETGGPGAAGRPKRAAAQAAVKATVKKLQPQKKPLKSKAKRKKAAAAGSGGAASSVPAAAAAAEPAPSGQSSAVALAQAAGMLLEAAGQAGREEEVGATEDCEQASVHQGAAGAVGGAEARQADGPPSTSSPSYPVLSTPLYRVPRGSKGARRMVKQMLSSVGLVVSPGSLPIPADTLQGAVKQAKLPGLSSGVLDDIKYRSDGSPVTVGGRFQPVTSGVRQQVVVLKTTGGLGAAGTVAARCKQASKIMSVFKQLRPLVQQLLPAGYEIGQASLLYNNVTAKRRPGRRQVWHTDYPPGMRHAKHTPIVCIVALEDTSLLVCPGSHAWLQTAHAQQGAGGDDGSDLSEEAVSKR